MNMNQPNQRQPDRKSVALSSAATRWLAMLLGLAMIGAAVTGHGAETRFKDYEVKAGFLYNFTKFIEWPTNCFRDTDAPFVIGVAGNSPCARVLDQITKGLKIGGRDIVIRVLETPEAASGAHLLFVPAAEDARLKEWLAAIQGANILTVGESEAFSKQGGMINFLLEGEKIRFEVNIEQTDAAKLKVSAQLQKLAKTIRRKS